MTVLVGVGRLVLIVVFSAAGVAKVLDRSGTRVALAQFGVPAVAVALAAWALPGAELVVAVSLVVRDAVVWAAVGAALLLVLFTAAMLRVVRRGEAPACRCFGNVASEPVGPRTIARNVALLGVAAVVGGGAGAGHAERLTRLGAGVSPWALAAAAAVGLQAAFSWQLLRQNGRLLARVEALETSAPVTAGGRPTGPLPRGVVAPSFALPDLGGRLVSLAGVLADGVGAVLIFTDPACGACAPLLPAASATMAGPRRVFISRGSTEANRAKAAPFGAVEVLLQADDEVGDLYGVYGFPGAVLVDAAGRIASDLVQGAPDILALLDDLSARPALELIHVGRSA